MQSQGYKYLQHMIVGKMLDRTTNKTMRSLKFVDKIEQSDRYKRLVEKKYAKLLKLKYNLTIYFLSQFFLISILSNLFYLINAPNL